MAAIQPNSDIWLLNDVPLDNTYQHTIYFANPADQQVTLAARTKVMLSDQSYQRVHRNKLRVQCLADDIYDCNYLMFRNRSFGNKWFYCFITEVEYINNVVSEITYEIDVMQTWMFDYELKPSYVEREHSATDFIGSEILPEAVETGEYVFNSYSKLINNTDYCVIVATVDAQGGVTGYTYDGIYGGLELHAFKKNDITSINAFIEEFVSRPDAVVTIYMCPTYAVLGEIPDGGKVLEENQVSAIVGNGDTISDSTTLDGYLPKNKKLLTYPYNFYHIDNGQGEELNLRYEFFKVNNVKTLTPTFEIKATVTQPVQAKLRPTNYKGMDTSKTETLTLAGFPLCSWNTDTYAAWVAQTAGTRMLDWGGTVAKTALGMAIVGPVAMVGGAYGFLNNIQNNLKEGYKASIAADICKGSTSSGNVDMTQGYLNYYGGRVSINANTARTIDDYFTMFGYTCNRVKTPNIAVRPHWTYTKTLGCVITGSVPATDANKICKIYDEGITFWRYLSEVGNYMLDNSPNIYD